MKDDLLPTAASAASAVAGAGRKDSIGGGGGGSGTDLALLGRGRYKFWALGLILLLAFWSMVTGSVSLRWSAGNLNPLHDDLLDPPLHHDLDLLEMDEREKVVRRMWDVYAHGRVRVPRFWQEAFEAAYQEFAGDDTDARDAAVAEIARMSMRMVDLEPPPAAIDNAHRHRRKNAIGEKNQSDASDRGKVKQSTSSSMEAK